MGEAVDRSAKHDMVVADQPGMCFQLLACATFDADAYRRFIALAGENILAGERLGQARGVRDETAAAATPQATRRSSPIEAHCRASRRVTRLRTRL